jgi:hypothetical protein
VHTLVGTEDAPRDTSQEQRREANDQEHRVNTFHSADFEDDCPGIVNVCFRPIADIRQPRQGAPKSLGGAVNVGR